MEIRRPLLPALGFDIIYLSLNKCLGREYLFSDLVQIGRRLTYSSIISALYLSVLYLFHFILHSRPQKQEAVSYTAVSYTGSSRMYDLFFIGMTNIRF